MVTQNTKEPKKKPVGRYHKYLYEGSPFQDLKKVKRCCLRCHRMFVAIGKFNRICKTCDGKNVKQHMDDYVDPGRSRR